MGVLNLDSLLGHTKQRIDKAGVELEGGYQKLPKGVEALERDGSIKLPQQVMDKGEKGVVVMSARRQELELLEIRKYKEVAGKPPKMIYIHVGELVGEPMEPAKVPLWVEQNYPSHINETCGMHVHMSFISALHYQRLMHKDYPETMRAYLTRWADAQALPQDHQLRFRLSGQQRHCTHGFFPDLQVGKTEKSYNRDHDGHRYTDINYCFGLHGTLECRVLPMMETPQLARDAVAEVLKITNACIVAIGKKKEPKEKVEVQIEMADAILEHRDEYLD